MFSTRHYMRSNNTCPACKHSYRSRYHATHCGGKSLSQWKASKIGHAIRQSTVRRTAGEIFASQHERPEFPYGEFDTGAHWRKNEDAEALQ